MLKVSIRQVPYRSNVSIVIWEEREGKRYAMKPVELVEYEIQEGVYEDDATLKLPRSLLQAFANALAEEGIKTDNDHKIQGTLEATKYHLSDLRTLLKLQK